MTTLSGRWYDVLVYLLTGALLLAVFHLTAHARDLDGHYAQQNPELHAWFDSLASKKGLCCSFADGVKVEDVDWDTKDGHYRVRLDGKWIDVPDAAVITEPNRFGPAVVWPYSDYEDYTGASTGTQIRCFMPGWRMNVYRQVLAAALHQSELSRVAVQALG